jgi:hypothetical protein
MAVKTSREQLRQKKINTRDTLAAAQEYCDRHGFCMPLEFFLAIGNGKDPRSGADVYIDPDDLGGNVNVDQSIKAMAEAAKYIYIPAAKVEVAGEVNATLTPVHVDEKTAESLAEKLRAMGIGAAPK